MCSVPCRLHSKKRSRLQGLNPNISHLFVIYIHKEVFFLLKQNMLKSAAALTLSGIIAKTIDFLFRAYYSKQLGSEGMGIFSLVFSFHGLILTFATGGLGVAVSKTVSEQFSRKQLGNIRRTMSISLFSVFVLSSFVIILTLLFSSQIATWFLKEPRCAGCLVFLSPSILFMSISYCIKGYFYAARRVLIPASSEFIEQAVKITSISYLLAKWLPYGIENGCEAVFLGISVGEFSSCLYLSLFYAKDTLHQKTIPSGEPMLQKLLRIALPAMTTSLAGSFLRMQEEVLMVSGLRQSGLSHTEALSQYGMIRGMAMPLVIFPLTLLSSCFTLLVPEISRAQNMKSKLRLKTLISRIYHFTAFGGFLVGLVLVSFSEEMSTWVYSAPQISNSVKIISSLAPIMFFDSVSCGILNGMGKQASLLVFSLTDSALRLGLSYILIPRFGLEAIFFIIIISNLYTAANTTFTSLRSANMRPGVTIFRYLLASVISFATVRIACSVFISGANWYPLLSIGFAVFVYAILSSAFCKTLRSDLAWLFDRMFLNV